MTSQRHLLFSRAFLPYRGGVQNYLYARCLAAPDHLTVVTAPQPGDQPFDVMQPFDIRRSYQEPTALPRLLAPWNRLRQIWHTYQALAPLLATGQYRVLELATPFPAALILPRLPRRSQVKVISFAHGDDILRPLHTWYTSAAIRRVFQRIDHFIAVSHYTANLLIDAGVPRGKVSLLHPGIDQQRFQRRGDGRRFRAQLPSHAQVLLTVSYLREKKNLEAILHIMARLQDRYPHLHYLLAGRGPDQPRLERLARELGLTDRVHFLGFVDDADLPDLYAAADVFLLLTCQDLKAGGVEGFGIVFLEAGSQEVPVIGPNEGGTPDAITDGITGFLVDPRDLAQGTERLSTLLDDSVLRQRMGIAGRQRALRPIDWSPLLSL